ncbi:MAG TPA: TlpA disulfide reductase family protein, partial [Abditibacteriaceae bacterium]
QLHRTYSAKGLKIVAIQSPGISEEENDWNNVKSVVKSWNLPYAVAFDAQSQFFKNVIGGTTYPTIFVQDPKGIVRFVQTGHTPAKAMELEAFLKKSLK